MPSKCQKLADLFGLGNLLGSLTETTKDTPAKEDRNEKRQMNETTTTNGNYAAPHRTFTEAIKVCFVKYVTFNGRASRSEFWWFFLCMVLLVYPFTEFVFDRASAYAPDWLILVSSLLVRLPLIAAGVRRLHDINYSGWWVLLSYVPIILSYIFIVATMQEDAFLVPYLTPDTSPIFWLWIVRILASFFVFSFLFVIYLSVKKGNPQENRFDRGQESFGFSFNRNS